MVLAHGLKIRPSEWPVRSRHRCIDAEFLQSCRQRNARQLRVMGEIAHGFDLAHRKTAEDVEAWIG